MIKCGLSHVGPKLDNAPPATHKVRDEHGVTFLCAKCAAKVATQCPDLTVRKLNSQELSWEEVSA